MEKINMFMLLYRAVSMLLLLITSIAVQAQDPQISYFEFDVDYTEDSTQHNIYYVLAVSGSEQVSNISIAVTDKEGQVVASLSSGITSLKAGNAYRVENGVLYLTIETGAHAPSAYYEAKAILTPANGEPLEYIRTRQM